MGEITSREERHFNCRQAKRTAKLLIEWQEMDGRRVIKSMSCDNPKLSDLDNWDCHWSCWEAVQEEGA